MSVMKITKDNFDQEVMACQGTVLLDFYADWCGPCRMVAPVLEEIAQEDAGLKVCKINVDEEPELAMQFQVSSIPLLVVMKDGEIVGKSLGAKPKHAILAMLP
jgi:thioredoxin 1